VGRKSDPCDPRSCTGSELSIDDGEACFGLEPLTHAYTSTFITDNVPSTAVRVDQPGPRAFAGSKEQFELIRTVLESSTVYSISATDPEGLHLQICCKGGVILTASSWDR
jgi:hypothetical protein